MSSAFPLPILAATLLWSSLAIAADPSRQEKEFIRRAIATMQDVAPRGPVQAPFIQIHSDDCHGWWGNLFGDNQPAALIAVEPRGNGKNASRDDASLFLLLWKNGWQVARQIGSVAASHDDRWWNDDGFDISGLEQNWCLKVIPESRACYLLIGPSMHRPVADHQSWRLDPSDHDLKPTGWPKDASVSISANSITMTGPPNNHKVIETIHHFDGTIGAEIITIQTESDSPNITTVTFTLPEQKHRPATAWLIRHKSYDSTKKVHVYSVCHRLPSAAATAFEENAVLQVYWGDQYAEDHSAARYLFHRLTGLGRAAYDAQWDQDEKQKLLLPKRVGVTGDPDAVKLFSLDPK
ncbi:hypothetical protein [Prosthecobacter sp.]|uniref:hypothetical protein n=1 Tax=Prosthecobacter sp. TaxID=1965333 RepID=UPI0037847D0C